MLIFQRPSIKLIRKRVIECLNKKKQSSNNLCCLLPLEWWEQFQRHVEIVEYDPGKHENDEDPGEIESSIICERESMQKVYCVTSASELDFLPLKPGLEEGRDFVVVPLKLGEKLEEWYGGHSPRRPLADSRYPHTSIAYPATLAIEIVDRKSKDMVCLLLNPSQHTFKDAADAAIKWARSGGHKVDSSARLYHTGSKGPLDENKLLKGVKAPGDVLLLRSSPFEKPNSNLHGKTKVNGRIIEIKPSAKSNSITRKVGQIDGVKVSRFNGNVGSGNVADLPAKETKSSLKIKASMKNGSEIKNMEMEIDESTNYDDDANFHPPNTHKSSAKKLSISADCKASPLTRKRRRSFSPSLTSEKRDSLESASTPPPVQKSVGHAGLGAKRGRIEFSFSRKDTKGMKIRYHENLRGEFSAHKEGSELSQNQSSSKKKEKIIFDADAQGYAGKLNGTKSSKVEAKHCRPCSPNEKLANVYGPQLPDGMRKSAPVYGPQLPDANGLAMSGTSKQNNSNESKDKVYGPMMPPGGFGSMDKEEEKHETQNGETETLKAIIQEGWERKDGVCGLRNLGNTCFMNTALQCLVHTTELREYFLSERYKKNLRRKNKLGSGGKVADSFYILLRGMGYNAQKEMVFTPKGLWQTIAKTASRFADYNQHDCQEFLTYILDGLHEDTNIGSDRKDNPISNQTSKRKIPITPNGRKHEDAETWKRKNAKQTAWKRHLSRNKSKVVDLFHGLFESSISCPVCQNTSYTYDPFVYLSLPIPLEKYPPQHSKRSFSYHNQHGSGSPSTRPFSSKTFSKYSSSQSSAGSLQGGRYFHNGHSSSSSFHKPREDIMATVVVRYIPLDPSMEQFFTIISVPYHGQDAISMAQLLDSIAYSFRRTPQEFKLAKKNKGKFFWINRKRKYIRPGTILAYEINKYHMSYATVHVAMKKYRGWQHQIHAPLLIPVRRGEKLNTFEGKLTAHLERALYPALRKARRGRPHFDVYWVKPNYPIKGDTYSLERNDTMPLKRKDFILSRKDDPKVTLILDLQMEKQEYSFAKQEIYYFFRHLRENAMVEYKNKTMSQSESRYPTNGQSYNGSYEADVPVQKVSLTDCFDLFAQPERLEERNSWKCEKCNKPREATKHLSIARIPTILVIHLKRFRFTSYNSRKVDTLVDFPLKDLDLSRYISCESKVASSVGTKYNLFAVCNHSGTLEFGHYTAYAKTDKGEWYHFDDSTCEKIPSGTKLPGKCSYILFYERAGSSGGSDSGSTERQ